MKNILKFFRKDALINFKYIYFIDLSCEYKLYIIITIFDILTFISTRKSFVLLRISLLISTIQCKRFYKN
ncbi:LOW QUALITY PROTEIN: hypothetical protein HZS_6748 [Henneguya salminicola]|nr:LOW QUALITY PROTEIN: hypothetical protein HZS_6748 [Henneguya salminicola]